jgi:formylglycine-generating enzyme required for sulfatase activity
MFTDMSFPATVSQFRLDRYEVTVGRFRAFVNAASAGDSSSAWVPLEGSGRHVHLNNGNGLGNGNESGVLYESGWDPAWNAYLPSTKAGWDSALACYPDAAYPSNTWTPSPDMNENRPLTCVSWYQAYAFCIWDGAFLPSDSEWDYAASGGGEQREYAWGDSPPGLDPSHAVYACFYPAMPFGSSCQGVANVAPVGSAPAGAGAWGQLDLTGNVYEWTLDYAGSRILPCVDCARTSGNEHPLRGGSWYSGPAQLFNSFGLRAPPYSQHLDLGFRCARGP